MSSPPHTPVLSDHPPVQTKTEIEWKQVEVETRKQTRQGHYDSEYIEQRGRVFFSNDGTLFFSPNCRVLPRWQPPHPDFEPKTLRELQLPVWYKRPEVAWKSCVMINMPLSGIFSCLRDQYCRQLEFNSGRNVWRLSPHVQQLWSMTFDSIEKCLWSIRDGSLGFPILMEPPPRPDHIFRKEYKLRGAANAGIVEARNYIIAWISAFFFFVRSCDRIVPLPSDDPLSEPPAHLAKSYPSSFTWLPKWFRILVRAHPDLQGWLSSVRSYWCNVEKQNIPGLFFNLEHYHTASPSLSWLYENNIPVWYPWGEKETLIAKTDPLVARFKPPKSMMEKAEIERYEEEHVRWEAGLETEVEARQQYDRDLSRQRREQEDRLVRLRMRTPIVPSSHTSSPSMSVELTERPRISFAPIMSQSVSSSATPPGPSLPPANSSSDFLMQISATPSSSSHFPVSPLTSPSDTSPSASKPSVTSHTSSNSRSAISASTHTSDMYRRQVPARPYGQDLVDFFDLRSVENAITESHESPEERDRRLRRDEINGNVRVYEWAEELAVQGSFMVLSMSERKYINPHARMEGARELLADPALSYLYDSHHNELHFVPITDTFRPPSTQKYRQLHPEFIDEEEERTFSPEIDISTGIRSITFEDDAVAVATIRLGFNPQSVERSGGYKVDQEMWKIVLSKLQSTSPSLETVSSSLAQRLWEFLESFASQPTHLTASKDVTETQKSPAAEYVHSSTAGTLMHTIYRDLDGLHTAIQELIYFHQGPHATNGPESGSSVSREHNSNNEATSPLLKVWTIDSPSLVVVGRGRLMRASPQPSTVTSITTCSDEWCLVVTSTCDALHASRLLASGFDTTEVALHLCKRGIPFRTMIWRGPIKHDHRPKPKPVRFDGHVWSDWDYREYLRERSDLLRIPWIRRACYLAGGILWRIATEVCGPPSQEMIEEGPSEGARRGEHASNLRGWVDDELPEDIIALIIGLYLCPQYPSQEIDELRELAAQQEKGQANLKRLSWWPLPSTFWHHSLGSLGHWSTRNEKWYIDRRNDLELCYLGEQVSSNPIPPKGAKQWRNSTRFGGFSKSLLRITEDKAGSMIRSGGKSLEESGLPYTS